MYDLERMMKTPIAKEALQDTELYNAVIEQLWKEDYRRMRDTMIYGESVEFDELIKMMRVLMEICNEN